jgi:hypothetical protein
MEREINAHEQELQVIECHFQTFKMHIPKLTRGSVEWR